MFAGRFYDWATRPDIAPAWRLSVVLGVTLVASVVLFLFRLKARCVYGCSEAVAGLYAAQNVATGDIHGPAFFFALLTAGVYLCVRGLDNKHQGATKPPLDPEGEARAANSDNAGGADRGGWRMRWVFFACVCIFMTFPLAGIGQRYQTRYALHTAASPSMFGGSAMASRVFHVRESVPGESGL
ncbi:hypothetical protein M0D69_30290 [Caballeronia sp. SEWSISQ10-4 2]|uniref:hypothetical protein n=1 Tax=Caballeronia sp. SEWSISQ10-4 2 TaxID=2937438 RepID=UPI002652AFFB|nr:hypothetical protein [Caballeronia sp. SEWSISQ10-4 2]MDN7182231.1 hypothetical protein [Caballeronia sp. SEWSISQ10-4 2]